MAAITLTPASLARVTGPTRRILAGEALIQGAQVYYKASDGRAYNSQSDGTTAEADTKGTALVAATAAGQPVEVQEGGDLDCGAVLTVGKVYCISTTAGKMIAADELLTTEKVTVVGVAKSTSRLGLIYKASGAAVP